MMPELMMPGLSAATVTRCGGSGPASAAHGGVLSGEVVVGVRGFRPSQCCAWRCPFWRGGSGGAGVQAQPVLRMAVSFLARWLGAGVRGVRPR